MTNPCRYSALCSRDVRSEIGGRLLAVGIACVALWGRSASAAGAEARALQRFEAEVRPILIDRCLKCHGADKQEGGLRLDSRQAILGGGDSGAPLVAGKPEESLLWQRINANEMPPVTEPRLTSMEKQNLKRWIEEGANVPDKSIDRQEARDWRRLWSLKKPDRELAIASLPPRVRDTFAVRSIHPRTTPREPDEPGLKAKLQAWYRAEDLVGAGLGDEDEVTEWPDRSGHGRHLRPTKLQHAQGLGGSGSFRRYSRVSAKPAVRFDEQTGFGSPGANPIPLRGDQGVTLSIVLHLRPRVGGYPHDLIASVGEFGFSGDPGRALAAALGIARVPGAGHQLAFVGGWGHDARLPRGSFAPLYHQSVLITIVKRPGPLAATSRFFINGSSAAELFDETALVGDNAVPDFQPRVARDFSVMLGNAVAGAGAILGDVAEFLVFSEALSDEQRLGVEAGLARRYQLTSLAPRLDIAHQRWEKTLHPLDAFVDAKISAANLTSAPIAKRETLIRRAYFDLLGLPPTPEQIDAFVQDPSPLAWEALVIELLASPHYGERWGRHWLDVARYADSAGFETEEYHRNAWRYRDWVIKAFNDDKPYDRFVQEQIAGDELWPSSMEGTGAYALPAKQIAHMEGSFGAGFFGLATRIGESRADAKRLRHEDATDWVDALGAAFLGMTVGCARCHDHKFDPISQSDYYALQAIFQRSQLIDRPILIDVEHSNWHTDYPNVLRVAAARDAYRLFEQSLAGRPANPDEQSKLRELRDKIAEAVLAVPTNTSVGGPFARQYDGLFEIPTATVLGHVTPPRIAPVHRLERGDLDQPRERVQPALPQALAEATGVKPTIEDGYRNRAQLALWLTRPDHPLTARVMVNRVWQGHFGRGLVSTPNDFGRMGQPPTHPELLDFLASQWVRDGWSLKALHQLILTSRAYQRGSFYADEERFQGVRKVDPENRLLTHFPHRRLEGESIWDAIHAVAGTLNLQAGGPPFAPPLAPEEYSGMKFPQQWVVSGDPKQHTRRGVYMLSLRVYRFPLFDIFDAPNNGVSSGSRDVSTVAPQSLWLLNNSRVWRQAQHLAARTVREAGAEPTKFVNRLWRIALGRLPTEKEREGAEMLLAQTVAGPGSTLENPPAELVSIPAGRAIALVALSLSVLNHNEFLYID